MSKKILLGHGSGGKLSQKLIKDLFVKHFNNEVLSALTDSALIHHDNADLAFTTDSFVVDPIFFPGGDIGCLAVCGTVNDLAVAGAEPLYLSASFIIEEGFDMRDLEKIIVSMAGEARKAGIKIVTGDTKVVNKGKCDKLFITTSGIGAVNKKCKHIASGKNVQPGDKIIINGYIGDHGIAVMGTRESLTFETPILSDAAPLNMLIKKVVNQCDSIHFMRDATRGGLATVLVELTESTQKGIELYENEIPVREEVRGMCEMFGFDPIYVANEGKVVMVVKKESADQILSILKQHKLGKHSSIIGEVVDRHKQMVVMHTQIGGTRVVDMLAGEQLPRIC